MDNATLSKQLGKRLCICISEENYVGTISEVNIEAGKITLIDVIQLSTQKKIESDSFEIKDISHHRLLENNSPITLGEKEFHFPSHIQDLLPDEFIVIENIDNEYHCALRHLKRQDRIGISVHGSNISRYHSFQWLCLSTPAYTYLFDILSLSNKAFTEGLRLILENSKIQKIIHDCRETSDCLYHQFGVKLTNIYDTQVADFFANIQRSPIDKIARKVRSLNDCLRTYLKIDDNYLPQQCNTIQFDERPPNFHIKDCLIKNVIYLRLLKKEIDFELRVPFRRCVDIYLQTVQKISNRQLELDPPKLESVPNEMILETMRVLKISEELLRPNHSLISSQKKQRDPYYKYKEDCKKYQTKKIYKESNLLDSNQEQMSYVDANGFDKSEIVYYLMSKMLNYKSTDQGSISSKEINTSFDNDISSDFTQTTTPDKTNNESCGKPRLSFGSDAELENCKQSLNPPINSSSSNKLFQNLISANVALSQRCFSDNCSVKDKIDKIISSSNQSHNSYNDAANIMKGLTKNNLSESKSSLFSGKSAIYNKLLDNSKKESASNNSIKSESNSSKSELMLPNSSSMKNSEEPLISRKSTSYLYRKSSPNDTTMPESNAKIDLKQLSLPVCSKIVQSDKNDLNLKQSFNATSIQSNKKFSFKNVDSAFFSLMTDREMVKEETCKDLKNNIQVSDLTLQHLNQSANQSKINDKKSELKDIHSNFHDFESVGLSSNVNGKQEGFISCQNRNSKTPISSPIHSDDWSSDEENPSKPIDIGNKSEDHVPDIFESSENDPYKKLRDAFSSLRPSEEDEKRVFVPAGM